MCSLFFFTHFYLLPYCLDELANARNEYLNTYTNECREGEIDLAITKREDQQDYRTYDTSDYDNDSHELRLTFRKYLGTTCTKEMRKVSRKHGIKTTIRIIKMCRKVECRS